MLSKYDIGDFQQVMRKPSLKLIRSRIGSKILELVFLILKATIILGQPYNNSQKSENFSSTGNSTGNITTRPKILPEEKASTSSSRRESRQYGHLQYTFHITDWNHRRLASTSTKASHWSYYNWLTTSQSQLFTNSFLSSLSKTEPQFSPVQNHLVNIVI